MRGLVGWSVPLLAALPVLAGLPDAEEEAREALARAEERVAKDQFRRAVSEYEKIAEEWPQTVSGRKAAERIEPNTVIGWRDIVRTGPSENRLDIVLMSEGFTLEDQDSWSDIAADAARPFERDEVFTEYAGYVNLIRANVVSEEGGVDGFGRTYSTALGVRIEEDTIEGNLVADVAQVKLLLDRLPAHDGVALVVVRQGGAGSGGDGVATIGRTGLPGTIHELGHALCNLRDEHVQGPSYRGPNDAPLINVSRVEDEEQVPWAHFIEAGVRGVGTYEGGDGRVRDVWRPTASGCLMNRAQQFGPVCREAIVLRIYEDVDPIDGCSPEAHAAAPGVDEPLDGSGPIEVRVRVLQPAKHDLEVAWWLIPAADAPPEAMRVDAPIDVRGRRRRGPLAPIGLEPVAETRPGAGGVHRLRWKPRGVEPGTYRLVCRVRDTTRVRGEKHAWVLRDPDGLLESERGWWVEVP